MRDAVAGLLVGFDWVLLVYFLVLNSVYLALVLVGAASVRRRRSWESTSGLSEIFANPLTPAISVIVPAHNEEASILDSVRSILRQRFPRLEVIVVDDGSTDRTFALLQEEFSLRQVDRVVPDEVEVSGRITGVHRAEDVPLIVVRKQSVGRSADAINAGINASRNPLVCMVDGDCVLEEDALLRLAAPYAEDPDRVVAVGGVIRAANGAVVENGRVSEVGMPRGWFARIQVVEYLRAFLLGRTGWARMGGLMIIAGAFGLFRRDVVVELGGMDLETVGQDAELTTRIHREMAEQGRDYRVEFVSDPLCWTEVPETELGLARQRSRWARGGAETVWRHRRMLGNPRYGFVGMVTMPFFLLFELIGPFIELAGILALSSGVAFGLVDAKFTLLVAGVAFGYGILLSLAAITVEEFSYRRYPRWRDLRITLMAGVLEWFGYRQLHLWWRIHGIVGFLLRRPARWGTAARRGFAAARTGRSHISEA